LPWSDEAERAAIGAVLLAPTEHAKKLVVRTYSGHFYDRGHGWIWEQMSAAIIKGNTRFDETTEGYRWLRKIHGPFKERFLGSVTKEIEACVADCFWWHGKWYIDQVIKAAKLRANVMNAAENLSKSLDEAERWLA
jgi:hypothetical protein